MRKVEMNELFGNMTLNDRTLDFNQKNEHTQRGDEL